LLGGARVSSPVDAVKIKELHQFVPTRPSSGEGKGDTKLLIGQTWSDSSIADEFGAVNLSALSVHRQALQICA
jgi:hypothetical protein